MAYANIEDARAWNRKRYSENRNEGKCVKCGWRWAEAGRSMCRICHRKMMLGRKKSDPDGSKHREWIKNREAERKAAGLCVDCGKKIGDDTGRFIRCSACRRYKAECMQVYRIRKRIHKTTV